MITRALGMRGDFEPTVRSGPARPGDVYLLCTDGLSEHVEADQVTERLGALPPAKACQTLVEDAYDAGAGDNITAVVVRIAD